MAKIRTIFMLVTLGYVAADVPCARRQIEKKSVVCVCNATYCDEITRDDPAPGKYVAYTSSEAGSRFKKQEGEFTSYYKWNEGASHTIVIDLSKNKQSIQGFGGAVTDAAGIHWSNFSNPQLQDYLINSYFGKNGLEYNMLRVPIGGCDFSTHDYAYNELPWNDGQLTNYTLSPEDFIYKIPMIQQIKAAATSDVHIVATVWSPPKWMKTNEKPNGPSLIKEEFMQTYADYITKFIREYKKHDIDIWAVTTTNEPQDAFLPFTRFQDLGWTPGKMGQWIINNLGPTIKNSSDINHVKILTVDDQRITIPLWFNIMIEKHPEVLNWIDGIGVHWYTDKFSPAAILEAAVKNHPDKFILATEACEGSFPWQLEKVSLGDWSRAQSYIHSILEDLNYNLVGWIDWNLCLDKQGGPNWVKNFVDSPIIVFPENNEFVKQPMFYAMGHFSKWIPRGSVRLEVEEKKGLLEKSVDHVAVLTPKDTVVVVLHNTGNARNVRVQLCEEHTVIALEKASVTTLEFQAPSASSYNYNKIMNT
ncbi:putative glucosylceramidase 3 [Leguminivora glycinivorella]|uniref:putative glucosylceramidase 3 n=1 Tax=Leguminivora glycinivorella TaxID=1035111 RepID=UPI00200BCBB5|nr:putative glucosylceramidase 3 [Leguminivora glycinivorella]